MDKDPKKIIIKKTDPLTGVKTKTPVRVLPPKISVDCEMSDLLEMGKNIAYNELTRLLAMSQKEPLTDDEIDNYSKIMRSLVDLKKIEVAELKDFNTTKMSNKQLLEMASQIPSLRDYVLDATQLEKTVETESIDPFINKDETEQDEEGNE